MRKVFLDELPKWDTGGNKGNINWENSIGYVVKFIYDDIYGELKIVEYTNKYLYIQYLEEDLFAIRPGNLLKCVIGGMIGTHTKKYKYSIEDIIKTNSGAIKITKHIRMNSKKYTRKGEIMIGEVGKSYLREVENLGEFIFVFSKNKHPNTKYMMDAYFNPKNYGWVDFIVGLQIDDIDEEIYRLENDFEYYIEGARVACLCNLKYDDDGVYTNILMNYFNYTHKTIMNELD